jgi:hypothetical protein
MLTCSHELWLFAASQSPANAKATDTNPNTAVPTLMTANPSTSAGGTGACTKKWWCSGGPSISITLVLDSHTTGRAQEPRPE